MSSTSTEEVTKLEPDAQPEFEHLDSDQAEQDAEPQAEPKMEVEPNPNQNQNIRSAKKSIKDALSKIVDNPIDMAFELPKSRITEPIDLSKLSGFKTNSSSSNECDIIARDDHGKLRRLNADQLTSLRTNGKIDVPSVEYADQNHTWRVSKLIQKGTSNVRASFYREMALVLEMFRYVVPHRIHGGHFITMSSSVKNFAKGLVDIPVTLFGWRNQKKKYDFSQIDEKMKAYYIREFLRRVVLRANFADQDVDADTGSRRIESYDLTNDTNQPSRSKLKTVIETIRDPIRALEKEWSDPATADERRRMIWLKLYPDDELSDSDSDQSFFSKNSIKMAAVLKKEYKAYKKQLFKIIRNSVDEVDAEALISLIENFEIYRSRLTDYMDTKRAAENAYRQELKTHSIKSQITEWVETKMEKFKKRYDLDHPIEDIYNRVSTRLYGNEKYIFDISRSILDSDEYADKKKRLQKKKVPVSGHTYSFRIWNPKNWIITEADSGRHYMTKDSHDFTMKSLFPGWKIANIFVRFSSYFWNGNFYLYYAMTREAFSLRSLVGIDNYYAGITVDNSSGSLVPAYERSTWFGRISRLWSNIKQSRSHFEDKPDKGIIGKGITRIFNVLWNYGFKGVLGTLICLLFHPILAIVCILSCFTAIITSPIWAMVCAVFMYLFDILVYDTLSGKGFSKSIFPLLAAVLYRMLLAGIGQFILSIVSMFAVSFGGIIVLLWSLVSNGIRSVYDGFVYHAILKHHAKIPAADGFLEKRISGPGLSSNYYYEINRKIGLLAIQYALEEFELQAYKDQMRQIINRPIKDLDEFYSGFHKLGMAVDRNRKPYKPYANTRQILESKLDKLVRDHQAASLRIPYDTRRIKMSTFELRATIDAGQNLCRDFMPNIEQRLVEADRQKFWSNKRLADLDYNALAVHCLEKVFGSQISISIEAADLDTSNLKRAELVISNDSVDRVFADMFNGTPTDLLDSAYKGAELHKKAKPVRVEKNIDVSTIFYEIDGFGVPHYDMVVSGKAYAAYEKRRMRKDADADADV